MTGRGEMERAIEAFVRGFCFQRSRTHPYLAERVGGQWRLHDEPRNKGTRREEYVGCGLPPERVHALTQKHARSHYCICAIVADGDDVDGARDGYKALGYRLNHSEFLMAHTLKRVPRVQPPVELQRVTDEAMADRLTKTARQRQILPEHLGDDSPQRSYVALADGAIVGWVHSIMAAGDAYCGGMYVKPEYRRRGIARSLLARMLRDDRAAGAGQAVLTASHAGARLYPVVGYRQLGTLLVLTPKRR